jgi:hypothetical protein
MRKVCLLLAAPVLASVAHAQQKTVSRFTVIRQDSLAVLRSEVVQKDLKLSEEQRKQVREAAQKYTAIDKQLQEQRRAGTLSPPDFNRQLNQSWSERDAAVAKILNAEQAKRFKQIQRQSLGPYAFTSPDLAAELGLTEQQLQAMREIHIKFLKRRREITREARVNKKVQEISALTKERDQELLKQLTPAQMKKWQELTGPPLPRR